MDFKVQIEKELRKISKKEDIVFFAWLCAVRALPFIGADGNFNYWKEEVRKKHLYAIFRALDLSYYYRVRADILNAINAINLIIERSIAATEVFAALNATLNAAEAAAKVDYDDYTDYVVSAVAQVANDARDAICDVAANFENVLFIDINSIKKGKKELATFDGRLNKVYGNVWDNFQLALEKEGCGYWGKLYQRIFEKSFQLDDFEKKELERRINVPTEIQQQGAAEVASYLEELKKGATHLNEARIIILGEKGAGKTCLARKLIDPDAPMTEDKDSTAGVDTTLWKPEQENMNVRIWDFAGHTVTHAVHQFFLSERCLYILVYDGRTEQRNREEYWLNQMKIYGGVSEVFIFFNKRDNHTPKIPIESLKEKYPIAGLDNTISRFIVRHNEEIRKRGKETFVWRYGVLLEDGNGTIALVREWMEERMITLSVSGKYKTEYLDKLRKTLNEIFSEYKSKKPELQYRVERFGQIPDEKEKSNPLWLSDSKIYNHFVNDRLYYDDYSNRDLPMGGVVKIYQITAENVITESQGARIDKSVRNTFNFHNCNFELRENLNDLARSLKSKGELEDAKELEDVVMVLTDAKECKTPEEIKGKGIVNKLKRIVMDLGDENSNLHKTVKGIKYGVSIAQDIAQGYNDIAQWCGLPQVPKPFLRRE